MAITPLTPGTRVSVLLVRRTPDIPLVTIRGTIVAYDGNVIQIQGQRVSATGVTYSEDDRVRPMDDRPRLFVVPLTSVRLIEVVEDARRGTDVEAVELPTRAAPRRRGR